jgi:hypothetical protein
MSNNQNNPGSGQINLPFPTITSTPAAPVGGWYVFQHTFPGTIYVDGCAGGGAVEPAEEKKINKDGCRCKKCKEFYPYAQANQEDGTLICYVCRKGF